MKPDIELDMLVRDLTTVGHKPKSEVRDRILEYRKSLLTEVIDSIPDNLASLDLSDVVEIRRLKDQLRKEYL